MSETNLPLVSAALPVRFVIYLPAASEARGVDPEVIESAVAKILCERFGGVTAYAAKGTFASASGEAQTEPITVLETYCAQDAWDQNREGMAACARLLARLLKQEALGCSVNGNMVLIEAHGESLPEVLGAYASHEVYALLQRVLE